MSQDIEFVRLFLQCMDILSGYATLQLSFFAVAPVAQWVKCCPTDLVVLGSSPD